MATPAYGTLGNILAGLPAEIRHQIYRDIFSDVPDWLPIDIPLSEYAWTRLFDISPNIYQEARDFFHRDLVFTVEDTQTLQLRTNPYLRTSIPPFLRDKYAESIQCVSIVLSALPAFATDYLAGPNIVNRHPWGLCPTGPYLPSLKVLMVAGSINVRDFPGPRSLRDPVTRALPATLSPQDINRIITKAIPAGYEILFWLNQVDVDIDAQLSLRIKYDGEEVSGIPITSRPVQSLIQNPGLQS